MAASRGRYGREAWEVDDIVAMMVGVRTDLAFPPKPERSGDEPVVLSASNFKGAGFGPVDFSVGAGEVVGIAGAEGNGQHEFVRTLVGLRRGRGTVTIEGATAHLRTPAAARKRGVVFQSGDRAAESVFRELSVMDNATLAARKELGPVGMIMASRQRKLYDPVARGSRHHRRVALPAGRAALRRQPAEGRRGSLDHRPREGPGRRRADPGRRCPGAPRHLPRPAAPGGRRRRGRRQLLRRVRAGRALRPRLRHVARPRRA